MSSVALDGPTLERLTAAQQVILEHAAYRDVDEWRRATTRAVARALGADKSAFLLPGLRGVAALWAEDYDSETSRQYMAAFQEDPWVDRGNRRAQELTVANRAMLFPRDLDDFHQSQYFNEVIRVARAFDSLQMTVPRPDAELPAALYVHHHRRSGPRFGQRGLFLMKLLRPAFEAAVTGVYRRHTLRDDLDRCGDAVLLMSRDGDCLYRNAAARRLLTHEREECLIATAEAVAAGCPGVGAAGATNGRRAPASLRVGVDGVPYHLVASLVDLGSGSEPTVAVTILQPGLDARTLDLGSRIAGLTPRQREVAAALAGRATNAEIAEHLNISEHTARRHTEAVMNKLGVRDRRRVLDALERLAREHRSD